MDVKVVAVITARHGSKGLPGKNYKKLDGIPLVTYSIISALQEDSGIDYIIVSSNCPHVIRIVREMDHLIRKRDQIKKPIYIRHRPEEISGDNSTNEEALIDAYKFSVDKLFINPTHIINLQPTSPLRKEFAVGKCVEDLVVNEYDSIMSVTKHTPFFWYHDHKDGLIKATYDFNNRPMRQDLNLEDYYLHDNGSIYGMTVESLLKYKCRLGETLWFHYSDDEEGYQIDTPLDFKIIETILNNSDQFSYFSEFYELYLNPES